MTSLGEYSISFNGWSTGCDAVAVTAMDGLRSRTGTQTRSGDIERGRAHGAVAGPLFLSPRTITVALRIKGTPEVVEAEVSALERACTISSAEMPLTWTMRDVSRQADCRVTNVDLPITSEYALGVARATLQFVATDPRIYGADQRSGSTGVASVTGGLGFPHGFPHGFGHATPGTIQVVNDGSTLAPWTATLTGPLSGPRISLVGTQGVIAFDGFDLPDGQSLVFDSRDRTILLNGQSSRYGSASLVRWFDLPVGVSLVQLSAAAGSGSLVVRWRDTYL